MAPSHRPSHRRGCTEKQGRHTTFHSYPQYLFPSESNTLASDLDVPYAFSHPTASFHWTKADALEDVRWNIWAQPPCLQCIAKGEVKARACDRMRRQNSSFGTVRTCVECCKSGLEDACIETIELRIDNGKGITPAVREAQIGTPDNLQHGLSAIQAHNEKIIRHCKTFFDHAMWVQSERRLRKSGHVIWKPINLHVGDAVAKVEILDSFIWSGGNEISRSGFVGDPGRFKRKVQLGRKRWLWIDSRETMKDTVAQWEGLDTAVGVS